MTHVNLIPKISEVGVKYGKFHASKEKLYVQLCSYMVPKASPLKASVIFYVKVSFLKSPVISARLQCGSCLVSREWNTSTDREGNNYLKSISRII